MAKKKFSDVEVVEEVTMPKAYRLEKGDHFVVYDPNADEFQNMEDLLSCYSTSMGEEISETDEEGNPKPHIKDKSLWFDVKANVVRVFKGHDAQGKQMWEDSPYARKFVISLDEKSYDDLIGEIRNPRKEAELKFYELAKADIEEITPEPVTFAELLDEGDEETSDDEESED